MKLWFLYCSKLNLQIFHTFSLHLTGKRKRDRFTICPIYVWFMSFGQIVQLANLGMNVCLDFFQPTQKSGLKVVQITRNDLF